MKFFSIILLSIFISFSSFAFLPSENKSTILVSENNTSSENSNAVEVKTKNKQSTKLTSENLIEKLESNKSKMNLKERLAAKLLTKKIKKWENRKSKSVQSSKDNEGLSTVFRIAGVVLILAGAIGLIASIATTGFAIGLIGVGLLLFILPYLI